MHGKDIHNSQNFLEHFAPNDSIISYPKLRKFVKHQINEYSKVQQQIEENALYYVYSEPSAVKDYQMLAEKIQEWEWFLDEILNDDERINTLTI